MVCEGGFVHGLVQVGEGWRVGLVKLQGERAQNTGRPKAWAREGEGHWLGVGVGVVAGLAVWAWLLLGYVLGWEKQRAWCCLGHAGLV